MSLDDLSTEPSPDLQTADSPPEQLLPVKIFRPVGIQSVPPRQWVYGRHLIRKHFSLTVAPSGVGKSSLELVDCLSIATGRALLGDAYKANRPMRVLYWNGEDPAQEIERRLEAICHHYGITEEQIGGRFVYLSGRDVPIKIAVDEGGSVRLQKDVIRAVEQTIVGLGIDAAIFDPFVSSHGVNENDNAAMQLVASTWSSIAENTNSAIGLVHHVRKGAHGQFTHTVDDGRGGWRGVGGRTRSARVLNVMTETDASKFGVEQRRKYFWVDYGKSTHTAPQSSFHWFKFVSIDFDNATAEDEADEVGVVTRWTPPNPTENVSVEQIKQAMEMAGDGIYKASSQAKDWFGHAIAEVIGLDLEQKADKARAVALQKDWLKKGYIKVVEKTDPKRREEKEYVAKGFMAELRSAQPA